MNKDAQTLRHTLMSQALGDLDSLVVRVEALPSTLAETSLAITAVIDTAGNRVVSTTAALDNASETFRAAVNKYSEAARADLLEFARRQATEMADDTMTQLRSLMYSDARAAFRTEASEKAQQLSIVLARTLKELRRPMWSRVAEHTLTAAITAICTAGLVSTVLHVWGGPITS